MHRHLSKAELGEPDAHVMVRRSIIVVGVLLSVAIVATVVLLCVFRRAVYLAGISAVLLFFVLVTLCILEQCYRASQLRIPGQTALSQEEIDADVKSARLTTLTAIGILLAIGSLMAAFTLADWSMVGIVAASLFLLSFFFAFPLIPSLLSDAERDEIEKLTAEPFEVEQGDLEEEHECRRDGLSS